jgi:hypothetical protein
VCRSRWPFRDGTGTRLPVTLLPAVRHSPLLQAPSTHRNWPSSRGAPRRRISLRFSEFPGCVHVAVALPSGPSFGILSKGRGGVAFASASVHLSSRHAPTPVAVWVCVPQRTIARSDALIFSLARTFHTLGANGSFTDQSCISRLVSGRSDWPNNRSRSAES